MKTTKRQLQAIKFASPDETRKALQALYLRGNEAIATDGHKLAIVTAPKEIENNGADPLLIAGDQVKQIIKMVKTKKNDDLEKSTVEITQQTIKLPAHPEVTYGDITMTPQIIDGKFPNIDQVLPGNGDRPYKFAVNARYLADICDYISKGKSGPGWCNRVEISFVNKDSSILIEAEDEDGHNLKFVLMPIRL